jgi:hypothetical protein
MIVLVSILCLVPLHADQREELRGVWGLNFGLGYEEVLALVRAKPMTDVLHAFQRDQIIIASGSLGRLYCPEIYLYFDQNRFYKVAFFPIHQFGNMLAEYDQAKALIAEKYGTATWSRDFDYPYQAGDGKEEDAVHLGKAEPQVQWNFKNLNSIWISVDKEKLGTFIVYTCGSIDYEVAKRESAEL